MSGRKQPSRRQRAIKRGLEKALNENSNSSGKKSINWGNEWIRVNPRSTQGAELIDDVRSLLYDPNFLYNIAIANAAVGSSIEKIASTFSSFKLNLKFVDKDNITRPVNGTRHTSHSLSRPNFEDTEDTFKYRIAASMMKEGGVYLVNSGGIYVVPPKDMQYDHYTDTYRMFGGQEILKPSQVVKIGKPAPDGSYGSKYFDSPLRNCLSEILLNSNIVLHSSNHLKNGAMIRGILQSTDSFSTQAQLNEMAESFNSVASGLDSSQVPALPSGYQFIPLQMTAAENGLIQLYELSKSTIIQRFGVPEGLLKNDYSSYNAAQSQKQFFLQNVIAPIFNMVEQGINQLEGLKGKNERFEFDRTDILSPEEKKQKAMALDSAMNAAVKMQQLGIYSANEIRKATGHDKILDEEGNIVEEANQNPFLETGLVVPTGETTQDPDLLTPETEETPTEETPEETVEE